MSFGFSATNDLDNKVLDSSVGIYTVVPASVTKQWSRWVEGSGYDSAWYERTATIIVYDQPYRGLEPPMIFMQGNGSHPSQSGSPFKWDMLMYAEWYNDIRYSHWGGPGNWTGVFIGMIWFVDFARFYNSDGPSPRNHNLDLRRHFMVAGTKAATAEGDYGMMIYDETGKPVFNSNDNFLKVTGYSGNWAYNYRTPDSDGTYREVHTLQDLVVPTDRYNEWITLIPFGQYRRYNGEVATVWNANLTRGQSPQVVCISGRSGSQFHIPVITARTTRPLEYRYS